MADQARIDRFIEQYGPQAEMVAEDLGVDPKVILAQWGLESNWGRSPVGAFNVANIKDPTGRGTRGYDKLEGSRDAYRDYASPEEAAADFSRLLRTSYPGVMGAGSDVQQYASALRQGKRGAYATDPNYEKKLASVYSRVSGRPMPTRELPQFQGSLDDLLAGAPTEDLPQFQGSLEDLLGAVPEPKRATLGSALVGGAKQIGSSFRAGVESELGSPEEAAIAGAERNRQIQEEMGQTASLEAVKRAYERDGVLAAGKEVLAQFPTALASNAANVAGTLAATKLGAMAGTAVAPGPGTVIGGAVGAGAYLFPQMLGSNVTTQAQAQQEQGQPVRIDQESARLAAAGQTALEAAGTAVALGGRIVKGVLGIAAPATAEAAQGLLLRTALGVLRGTSAEMPVEVAQTVLERWQAKQDLLSPEAYEAYGESAYAGTLVGGGTGGLSNAVSGRPRPPSTAPRTPEERQARIAEVEARLNKPYEEPAEDGIPEPTKREAAPTPAVAETVPGAQAAQPEAAPTAPISAAEEASAASIPTVQGAAPVEGTVPAPVTDEVIPEPTLRRKGSAPMPPAPPPNPAFEVPIAQRTGPISQEEIDYLAPQTRKARAWLEENALGRTWEEVAAFVEANPELLKGRSALAQLLNELLGPQSSDYVEPTRETAAAPSRPEPVPEQPAAQPSVGVSAPVGDVRPAALPAPGPVAPDGAGVVSGGPVAEPDTGGAGPLPAPLNEPATPAPAPVPTPAAPEPAPAAPAPAPVVEPEGTVAPLAARLAKNPNPILAEVGRRARVTGTKLETLPDVDPATQAYGRYDPETDTAQLAGNFVFDDEAVAHELVHAQVSQAIENPSVRQKPVVMRLEKLFDYVKAKAQAGDIDAYGITNTQEFIAEGLSNPDFQELLKAIPYARSKSVWSEFVQAIADLLGLKNDTALQELLQVYDDLAQPAMPGKKPKLTKPSAKVAPAPAPAPAVEEAAAPLPPDEDARTFWEENDPEDGSHIAWDDLPQRFKTDWREAVADGYASAARHDEIVNRVKQVERATRIDAKVKKTQKRDTETTQDLDPNEPLDLLGKKGPQITAQQVTQASQPARPQDFMTIAASAPSVKGKPGVVKRAVAVMLGGYDTLSGQETTLVNRFRTYAVDSMAAAVQRFDALFDSTVRSQSGLFNPKLLMRQAADAGQLLGMFVRDGSLRFSKDLGIWETYQDKNRASMETLLTERVPKMAANQGMTVEEARAYISKVLEGVRLDGIRRANAKLPPGAPKAPIHSLNPELNPRNSEAIKNAQIDAAVTQYNQNAELQQFKRDLDAIKDGLIDNMVQVGRITDAQAADWKAAVDYVPFDRLMTALSDPNFRMPRAGRTGISEIGGLRELVGSESLPVGDVLDNSIKLYGWMIGQTLRTDATTTGLRMLEAMGNAKYIGKAYPGIEQDVRMVKTWINGEVRYFQTDDKYVAMAFSQPTDPQGTFVLFAQGFANVLRKTITSLPPFAVRQLVMDIQRAYIQSGLKNPSKVLYPALKYFFQEAGSEFFRGVPSAKVQALNRLGIGGAYDINMRDPAQDVLANLGVAKRGVFAETLHRFESITRASDVAVRLAIYERTLEEAKASGQTAGAQALASARAREFINFRRRGSAQILTTLTATIPFFNAYLQGMDLVYRTATGIENSSGLTRAAAQRSFLARGATLTALGVMYAFMVGDEPEEDNEYEKLSDFTRLNNFIIPGTGVRIPVATEWGAIFKAPAEIAMKYYRSQGTTEEQEAAELTSAVMSHVWTSYFGNVTPIPAVAKPVLEAWANYSFFTGRELEGAYQQGKDKSKRTTTQTSELAKALSKAGEKLFGVDGTVSPIIIDNFLRGYFGSVAPMVTMATDQLFNPDKLDRPMSKYWFFSSFMYDADIDAARKEEAYRWNETAAKRLSTYRSMEDQLEKAEAYFNEHARDIALGQQVEKVIRQSSDYREAIRYLTESPVAAAEYSKEEREEMIKEYRAGDAELFKGLRAYRTQLRQEYPD